MWLRFLFFIGVISVSFQGYCTNYLSSSITFNGLGGSCFTGSTIIEVTLELLMSKDSSTIPANVLIHFGDGQYQNVVVSDSIDLCNNLILARYSVIHSYFTCGTYSVGFVDSSYIPTASNYINAQSQPYSCHSILFLSAFVPDTYSPSFLNETGVIKAIKGDTLKYNFSTIDDDGDSLSFELAPINTAPDYWIPSGISINEKSGEITWVNPDTIDNFTFLLYVKSYLSGWQIQKSSILKHFTISVDSISLLHNFNYTSNWNTNSFGDYEYHLVSNQNLQLFFEYSGLGSDSIDVYSYSELYALPNSATFSVIQNGGTKYGLFDWTPIIQDERTHPYIVSIIGVSHSDTLCFQKGLTVMIYVDNINDVSDIEKGPQFNIFPNPTYELVNFQLANSNVNYDFSIFNSVGKLVETGNFSSSFSLNILNWQAGVYHVVFSNAEGRWNQKIVKIK